MNAFSQNFYFFQYFISKLLENRLITLSRDVEINPGLKQNYLETFPIFQWNQNNISADTYAK